MDQTLINKMCQAFNQTPKPETKEDSEHRSDQNDKKTVFKAAGNDTQY